MKIGQIEANAQRQGFETVPMSDLVAELAEIYEPVAAENCKQLEARIAPDVELRGDRALLAQMISNLLENAIEHTPAGTHISVELDAAEDRRRLVVADDGPGIPPAEGARIFERFYRLDRGRSKPGNGLGLSLVKSICGRTASPSGWRSAPAARGSKSRCERRVVGGCPWLLMIARKCADLGVVRPDRCRSPPDRGARFP